MNVTGTPVNARLRFTYPNTQPPLTINGVRPGVTALQVSRLADALGMIQATPIMDAYLTREVDLVEGD